MSNYENNQPETYDVPSQDFHTNVFDSSTEYTVLPEQVSPDPAAYEAGLIALGIICITIIAVTALIVLN